MEKFKIPDYILNMQTILHKMVILAEERKMRKRLLVGSVLIALVLIMSSITIPALATAPNKTQSTKSSNNPYLPPSIPELNGPTKVNYAEGCRYFFCSTDPQGLDIYYHIDFDNNIVDCCGPYHSGDTGFDDTDWEKIGDVTVRCYAYNTLNLKSDWATLIVHVPLDYKPPHPLWLDFLFEHFPSAFPLLQKFLGYNT